MRLIDVEAAIERARKSDEIVGSSIWETSEVVEFLDDCPIVDAVEVVHGRWVTDGLGDGERVCSVCKRYALYTHRDRYDQYLTAYCHNCGAKMDGDGNGTA